MLNIRTYIVIWRPPARIATNTQQRSVYSIQILKADKGSSELTCSLVELSSYYSLDTDLPVKYIVT